MTIIIEIVIKTTIIMIKMIIESWNSIIFYITTAWTEKTIKIKIANAKQ